MKIGIDIDNVITDTVNGVLDYINERLPVELTINDIEEYWMEAALPEQYQWIVAAAFNDSLMWKNVKMIEGAAQYIGELYNDGHKIYFVTATTPNNFKKKIGFLERSLPFFPQGYVCQHSISIQEKQLLRLDVLIDDYLDNLIGEKEYLGILFDYPWNRNTTSKALSELYGIARVYNWAMAYETINKLKREKAEGAF